MVVARLVGDSRPAFVNDEPPRRIRLPENGLAILARDDGHGEQIDKDRDRLIQRPAFVVAVSQANGFQHTDSEMRDEG